MTNVLFSLGIILVTFVLALGLTARAKTVLLAKSLLDHPNERSSHTIPIPRGGGWALVLILVPALIIIAVCQGVLLAHSGLIAGTLLLATISWWDDRKGVGAGKRLFLHFVSACLGSLAFSSDQMVFSGTLPFWLDRLLMIMGWAWFMNLYNFMDGIDGITGVETISLATGTCLVMIISGVTAPYTDILTLVLTGSCLGFLAFNWHPAKIFLGDIGSVPLGFLTGFILLSLAVHGQFIPALILPLYYLADSGITLSKRALRGEKIWLPHRQHYYQLAAHRLQGHDKVVYRILAANLTLIGLGLLAISMPWVALPLAMGVIAILLRWMHKP